MSLLKMSKDRIQRIVAKIPPDLASAVKAAVVVEANRAIAKTKRLPKAKNRKYFRVWSYYPDT